MQYACEQDAAHGEQWQVGNLCTTVFPSESLQQLTTWHVLTRTRIPMHRLTPALP